jgi:hypothetical protein
MARLLVLTLFPVYSVLPINLSDFLSIFRVLTYREALGINVFIFGISYIDGKRDVIHKELTLFHKYISL